LDNRYYDNVIAEMQSFLDENNFKPSGDSFVNDTKKITVKYNTEKQTYSLLVADKVGDEFTDEVDINTWLFDDSQNAKDAGSVGIDFVNSLKKNMGIRSYRGIGSNVELPTASKNGNITIAGFTKKMLDVFPSLKDAYKDYVALYRDFLYINFYGEYLVPELKALFEEGNKKQIKKVYDIFGDVYIKGDKDTVNILVAVLAASSYNNEKAHTSIEEMLADNGHFLQAYNSFRAALPKSKKLFKSLVK